ncbi:MAG: methyltransferase domain-containing protein [Bacteroidota bacterium]
MKSVKEYYNKTGWTKQKGKYVDALSFTTTKGDDYQKKCHNRLREQIGSSELLLDVACGAFPFNSNGKKQLCIDFSITAVTEAKRNKPDGIFVLGDITSLPLKNNCVADTVSMHTIYHVNKDKQEAAIKELIRVTKNKCYIVYNAGKHAKLVNILSLPLQLWNWTEKRINPNSKRKIYFYAHSYNWLERFGEIKTYRLLNENCIRLYSRLLWLVSKFEMRFPRHSYHPLLVIDKSKIDESIYL